MADNKRIEQVSKKLSYLLRHGALKANLNIRSDGLALLSEACQKVKCSESEARLVTEGSDKKRFTIVDIDGKTYIRANQGHSIPVPDLALQRITKMDDLPQETSGKPAVVVHGTYFKAWEKIKQTGLSRMGRNHIHFAIGTPGESHVISGMRSSSEVLIYVDLVSALHDGYDFFLSDNHVVLSPGNEEGILPTKYFKAVLDASTEKPFDSDFPKTLE